MASFYLDEDIPIAVASYLTAAGHSARTTLAAGRLGRWDADQLLYATEQGLTLVTHNRRDFHALHEAWLTWAALWRRPHSHRGILILDKGYQLAAGDYAAAILTLLGDQSLTLDNYAYDWFARRGGEWVAWRSVAQ